MPSTEEAQSLKHWTTRKVLLLFFGGVGGAGGGEQNSCLVLDLWVKKLKLSFGGDQVRTESSSLKVLSTMFHTFWPHHHTSSPDP